MTPAKSKAMISDTAISNRGDDKLCQLIAKFAGEMEKKVLPLSGEVPEAAANAEALAKRQRPIVETRTRRTERSGFQVLIKRALMMTS